MTPYRRAALAALFVPPLFVLQPAPACAQWQAGIGAGLRHAVHTEVDTAGKRLVRETGWLPGIAFQGAYRMEALALSGAAEWYRGDLDYRGRTQGGAAAASTTATGLASVRLGASYAVWNDVALSAAIESDRWRRDIRGTAGAAGLQETYRSSRFLAGVVANWHPAPGLVSGDAALVVAAPERMRVGFSGLFDTASLDTERGHGLRLGAALRPAGAPYLELRTRADWLRVPRSGDVPLTSKGRFVGTIAQPEHTRRAVTLTLSAIF